MRRTSRATQRGASIGLMLFGLIFFAVGAAVVLFFPIRGAMHCGGDPPMCALERGGLLTPETRAFAATDIVDVVIDEHEDDEGDMVQRPVLVLKSGETEPVREVFSNMGDTPGDVAKIQAWRAAPTETLVFESGMGWFAILFGGVFALVGLVVMVLGWVNDGD